MTAPKKEKIPPTIHARYTSRADPAACIISAGTRKIPLPITTPTTIEAAWLAPKSRRRPVRVEAALVNVARWWEYR